MRRVIVCGGRKFVGPVGPELDRILAGSDPDTTVIVTGGASGVDSLAHAWAYAYGYRTEVHTANWSVYGRAAGPIRNQKMLDLGANLVIAFPGGRGTEDMLRRARKANVEVKEVW